MRELFNKITLFILVLILIILAIPYGTVQTWWEVLFILEVFILAGIHIFLFIFNRQKINLSRLTLPLLVLAVFAYLQSLYILPGGEAISADPAASWFFSIRLLALILFFELIRITVQSYTNLSFLLTSIIVIAVIVSVFGIVRELFLGGQVDLFLISLKPGGFAQFINRNHFAMFVNMALGLVAGFVFNQYQKEKRSFFISLGAVLLAGLALSLSRGGIFAFSIQVILGIIIFFSGKTNGKPELNSLSEIDQISGQKKMPLKKLFLNSAKVLILILILTAGIIWIGGEKLSDRVSRIPGDAGLTTDENADLSRIEFWQYSLEIFRENALTGAGFGGYPIAIDKHFQSSGRLELRQAHNDYVEFLANGGGIGLAIGLWFLINLGFEIRSKAKSLNKKYRPHFYGAIISLTGVAVHSIMDFGLHILINTAVFFCLLAVISAPEHFIKKKGSK